MVRKIYRQNAQDLVKFSNRGWSCPSIHIADYQRMKTAHRSLK